MLVLIGKMENQFLELEPAKLSPSLNSIYLLSTLHSTLMDQVGAHKANDTVPFIASFCNLSPCPLRWVWMPEAKLALWRDKSWPPNIYSVLSANWLPGEENIFGSNCSTKQARDLKKRQGTGGRHVILETNKHN